MLLNLLALWFKFVFKTLVALALLVSGEAIIVNKEETGSLKERRDC